MIRLALCFLLLSGGVGAATYQAVLDQTTYSYSPGLNDVRFTSSSLPGLTANFATDKLLTVTLSAPAGFHFSFHTPPTVDSLLYFNLGFDTFGIAFPTSPGSIVFGGTSGTLPAMTARFWYFDNGLFAVTGTGTIGGAFTFSSMTFSSPVPAGYHTSFDQVVPSTALLGGVPPSLGPDPGQWAFLEADAATVPEPASVSLVLGALGVLTALGRKSHN